MKELQTKYKNGKIAAKRELSGNAREMRKTGGGTATIVSADNFGLSVTQVSVMPSRFDSDMPDLDGSGQEYNGNEETDQLEYIEEEFVEEIQPNGILSTVFRTRIWFRLYRT